MHDTTNRLTVYPPSLREQPVGDSAVPRMELHEWAERYGVVAGITTRGRRFPLGLWSEENVGQVMSRWRAFRAAFRSAFPAGILARQVDATLVQWHRHTAEGWLILDGIDGHATGTRGMLLTITGADCVPVYLTVPHKQAVALLHAGWRGAAGRILERGVELVRREAFVRASGIVMHFGGGVCGGGYVGGFVVPAQVTRRPQTAARVTGRRA